MLGAFNFIENFSPTMAVAHRSSRCNAKLLNAHREHIKTCKVCTKAMHYLIALNSTGAIRLFTEALNYFA